MPNRPKILTPEDPDFPDVDSAMTEPNGLLAIGGDLAPTRLLNAYQHGIFPWYDKHQPIMWWSPDPRAVLYLDKLHISNSLQKVIAKQNFTVTFNQAFSEVIHACAKPRKTQKETWISPKMIKAYCELHTRGHAKSIEIWQDEKLIGGLYGVDLGNVFCGESMFNLEPNAAKIALVYLVKKLKQTHYKLIDCQIYNEFLASLGAEQIPRRDFLQLLK